jgi:xylem cysteine proteinase
LANLTPPKPNRPSALTGYVDLANGRQRGLLTALKQQPLSVAITATREFQFYVSGIITQTTGASLNHAVLLFAALDTGATSTSYLTLKNSWGASWGEAGYMRFALDQRCNSAGALCAGVLNVNTAASYPTVS